MKKIYCEPCEGTGKINDMSTASWHDIMGKEDCPVCAGLGYTLQGCKNCKHQDGGIGGTISALKGEIIETDATQYHCAHHEQYLPAGITCEEWRVKL